MTIHGRVVWQDGRGFDHSARYIVVKLYSGDDEVSEATTDQSGCYAFTVSRDDLGDEVRVRFYAKAVSSLGTIVEVKRGNSLYYARTPVDVPPTASYVDAGLVRLAPPTTLEIVDSIVEGFLPAIRWGRLCTA